MMAKVSLSLPYVTQIIPKKEPSPLSLSESLLELLMIAIISQQFYRCTEKSPSGKMDIK